ncbi:MAG: hypothetical protein KKE94_07065, partial [Gammaproteobacteria bacterium]|nr:hypothetical protein [Gammaproteobacteria bacterium]
FGINDTDPIGCCPISWSTLPESSADSELLLRQSFGLKQPCLYSDLLLVTELIPVFLMKRSLR